MGMRISQFATAKPEAGGSEKPPVVMAPTNHCPAATATPIPPPPGLLRSGPCRQDQLESQEFLDWKAKLKTWELRFHRKDWEWSFICQALQERGMLRPGRRGLGFAVGREQLAALFAGMGCRIVATDLDTENASESGWVQSNQHSGSDSSWLNQFGICDAEVFRERVSYRAVDMRALPEDLRDFDFAWSSCSLEHLGSLQLGERFVMEAMRCLKPGGIAVHTTEFNVNSNAETMDQGGVVLYRRRDLESLAAKLRAAGHGVDLDFDLGNKSADLFVQQPPYRHDIHLRIQLGPFVVTSYGILIEKSPYG